MLIQPITPQNYNKIPRFKGEATNVSKVVHGADTFVKSTKSPILVTVADIKNYLKQNADKILNGKIFNTPLTKDGDSLLMAILRLKPLEEERDMYYSIIFQMSRLDEINYDQKDSMNISALEWVITTENADTLSLMKNKKITQDPMLHNAYKSIKNPEFKKALLASGTYIPPVLETEDEKRIVISSIISKKHNGITDSNSHDIINKYNIIIALCNKEDKIQNDMVVVFKKIIDLSSVRDIEELPEAIKLLKDDNGNVNTEKAAHFLAEYCEKNGTLQSAAESVARKYKLEYKDKHFDSAAIIDQILKLADEVNISTNEGKAQVEKLLNDNKDILSEEEYKKVQNEVNEKRQWSVITKLMNLYNSMSLGNVDAQQTYNQAYKIFEDNADILSGEKAEYLRTRFEKVYSTLNNKRNSNNVLDLLDMLLNINQTHSSCTINFPSTKSCHLPPPRW